MRLLLWGLVWAAWARQLHLAYDHALKSIQVYDSNDHPLHLLLTFDSPGFSLMEGLRRETLFLNRKGKYRVEAGDAHVTYDYKVKGGLSGQAVEVVGSVGVGEGSELMGLLKKMLGVGAVKLQVRHKEGVIVVVPQACSYPLFAPFTLTLSQANTHSYTLNALSTVFRPDASFLKVMGRDKSPFQMTAAQLGEEMTLSVRNKIISVPLKELLVCGQYSGSESYECEVKVAREAEMGGLLMSFDPVLCGAGVELEEGAADSWGYSAAHLTLLALQMVLLACLVNESRVLGALRKMLGGKYK